MKVLIQIMFYYCDEKCSSWYLDTGCSNHMTENKEWLIDLGFSVNSSVRFVYNSTIAIKGIG